MAKSGGTDCTMILGNKQVGDSSFHLTPSIKETPIAVLVFNIIYTLWGTFYCGTIFYNWLKSKDNGSAEMRKRLRGPSTKERPNYVSQETWDNAHQKRLDAMTLPAERAAASLNAAVVGSKQANRQAKRANSPRRPRSGGRPANDTRGGRPANDTRDDRPGSKRSRSRGSEQPPRSVSQTPPSTIWPPASATATLGTPAPFTFGQTPIAPPTGPRRDTGALMRSIVPVITARHTKAAGAPSARASSPSRRLAPPPTDRYGGRREGAAPPRYGP